MSSQFFQCITFQNVSDKSYKIKSFSSSCSSVKSGQPMHAHSRYRHHTIGSLHLAEQSVVVWLGSRELNRPGNIIVWGHISRNQYNDSTFGNGYDFYLYKKQTGPRYITQREEFNTIVHHLKNILRFLWVWNHMTDLTTNSYSKGFPWD